MWRTLLSTLVGLVVGAAVTAGLLAATHAALARWTAPRTFAIDHGVIYLGIVLGAGFGSVAGGLVGLAGAIDRARRAGSGKGE